MAFTSVQKIRFDDVDGAGIVYYPQFFHLCHNAFEDFFDDAAPISYPEMIVKRRQGFPTVAIESTFSSPLAYGDVAIVSMHVLKVGTSSVQSRYEIRRKTDGLLSFTADITTVFMDLDAKKAIPLPDDFRVIFERLLAA